MILALLLFLLLVGVVGEAQAQTIRYTKSGNAGASGNACTQASRCTNKMAESLSAAGDFISLQGGTLNTPLEYNHADDVIVPTTGRDGVTVSCEIARGWVINGDFIRVPVDIPTGSDNWTIEDINGKNGNGNVFRLRGNNGIVRRAVGWDIKFATVPGTSVFSCTSTGNNNLFEDVAAFGIA